MSFGLTNVPSMFQRLMKQSLRGLNPEEGPDFITVYINDVLVFYREHLHHLHILERCEAVGTEVEAKHVPLHTSDRYNILANSLPLMDCNLIQS